MLKLSFGPLEHRMLKDMFSVGLFCGGFILGAWTIDIRDWWIGISGALITAVSAVSWLILDYLADEGRTG